MALVIGVRAFMVEDGKADISDTTGLLLILATTFITRTKTVRWCMKIIAEQVIMVVWEE